ncbi:MAG: dihydrolipoyl dehydrogenase [Gammaproteobacteria bacterium]|nr:dihydrolipoyl dehydrogenase [Gammaproteobacteria bacterium]MCP5316400.1 dihydrolipoyl dehydrogenase [Chromatiaceae bacterium]MCW5587841.1 dihydrolipoyl dehydrogenase [Chromatiales bacterium]MCB1819382.1 dihydrolipoyl dehydrogenase [Gammaproteobacteria bacterium]MCP5434292.1 dihydrolipoyl dehydrogenase [Chromatiaceae bacterium]
MEERQVDVAIIGSGSAGLYAMSKVRPSGKSVVLINGGELGTTCARVGCMPSKAVIQIAEDFHRRGVFKRFGVEGHERLSVDVSEAMGYVQDLRDVFVERVISNSTDKMPEGMFVAGYARFVEPNLLEMDNGQRIRAGKVIIATGSRPIVPAAWAPFRDRIITTDDFFELEELPASIAVIGLGVIGLEIGQSLHRLGCTVVGIDIQEAVGGLTDPVAIKSAVEIIGGEMELWLGHEAQISEGSNGRLRVSAGGNTIEVERVLASMGRQPNVEKLGLDAIGVPMDERGVPLFDPGTMQVGDLPLFLAGDVTGERPLLHEAGDEGRIAGQNAVSDTVSAYRRKTPLNITFCDPNIVQVGQPYASLDPETTAIGEVQMAPVGRAIIMAKNKGVIRVYADKTTGTMLGAEMVCIKAENLGHLLAWSIQQGLKVGELLQMPFYHPVIEEALQAALYDLYAKVDAKNPGPITELSPL